MWGANVVGMTLVPECVFAREAELCYATTAMITDYDCWKEHAVTTDDIIMTMRTNIEKVKTILAKTVEALPEERACDCEEALKNAFV